MIHVARNSTPLGTFSEIEIKEGLGTGRFLLSDLGWKSGMAQWKALGQWTEFAPSLQPAVPVFVPGEPAIAEPAWERRAELGEWRAFWQTVRSVLFSPSKTFSSLPRNGNIGGAFIFYVIPAMVMTILSQVISMVSGFDKFLQETATKFVFEQMGQDYAKYVAQQAEQMEKMPSSLREMMMAFQIGGAVVGTIIGVIIGIFITAGITHLMLLIVGGAKRPFATTFRAKSYISGSIVFITWIPVVGPIIMLTYGSALNIIALARAHGISIRRSAVAVLLPVVATFCCFGVIIAGSLFFAKTIKQHMPSSPTQHTTTVPATPAEPDEDE